MYERKGKEKKKEKKSKKMIRERLSRKKVKGSEKEKNFLPIICDLCFSMYVTFIGN